MRALICGAVAMVAMSGSAQARTWVPVKHTCPVGGEKFEASEVASDTTFGSLPDGMPIGTGDYPIQPPQCPGNGLVLYRDFDQGQIAKLTPFVAGADYQALRKDETRFYLAAAAAGAIGDDDARPWLLLRATWEAKNGGDASRIARYNEAFVSLVRSLPAAPDDLASVAIRARAVNALRELGRFEAADDLRKSIVIAPGAGGNGPEAAENRAGWTGYLTSLATVIARRDAARMPIDMVGPRLAAQRCVEPEVDEPLTAFDKEYCAGPAMAKPVKDYREMIKQRDQ